MKSLNFKKWIKLFIAFIAGNFISKSVLASTTSNFQFVSALNTFSSVISGPVLISVSIIMIIVTCLMLAFGEWGDGFRRFITVLLWIGVASSATGFVSTMFGSGAVC